MGLLQSGNKKPPLEKRRSLILTTKPHYEVSGSAVQIPSQTETTMVTGEDGSCASHQHPEGKRQNGFRKVLAKYRHGAASLHCFHLSSAMLLCTFPERTDKHRWHCPGHRLWRHPQDERSCSFGQDRKSAGSSGVPVVATSPTFRRAAFRHRVLEIR